MLRYLQASLVGHLFHNQQPAKSATMYLKKHQKTTRQGHQRLLVATDLFGSSTGGGLTCCLRVKT